MKIALFILRSYKNYVSPFFHRLGLGASACRFSPTCSDYAYVSIEKHGLVKGTFLFSKRIIKCHPFFKGESFDPVP